MNYAEIKYCDIANGEGVRTTLFVSGCSHHCKNCFQPQTWSFNFGNEFTPDVQEKILASLVAELWMAAGYWTFETLFLGEAKAASRGFCRWCAK